VLAELHISREVVNGFVNVCVGRDLPPELVGVSVKDLVKAIGESRANGNGVTPPGTPRRTSRSSSPKAGPGGGSSPRLSRSSSPVPIPGMKWNVLFLSLFILLLLKQLPYCIVRLLGNYIYILLRTHFSLSDILAFMF
jgi:hypothetical protein